jgi:hypothetical protein
MVSLSDVQTPAGWRKIQVFWDLSVTALDSASCRYTNQVLSYPTPAFMETLKVAGISFENAAADRQAASDDHNRRETALYAVSNGRPWPAIRLLILFRRMLTSAPLTGLYRLRSDSLTGGPCRRSGSRLHSLPSIRETDRM